MAIEFGIGLVVAVIAAFFLGRRSTSRRAELDALQGQVDELTSELESTRNQADAELAEARAETARVQAGVTSHFEQSAVLFGNLAQNYRSFIEHFADSAQALGLSEAHAHELLDQIARPLISHTPETGADAGRASTTAGAPSQRSSKASDEPFGEPSSVPSADAAADPGAPKRPTKTAAKEPPTLDPISAKVAEIELEENTQREAPRRAS